MQSHCQVVDTRLCVTKQYYLVLAKGWRRPVAWQVIVGLVKSNGSLLWGLLSNHLWTDSLQTLNSSCQTCCTPVLVLATKYLLPRNFLFGSKKHTISMFFDISDSVNIDCSSTHFRRADHILVVLGSCICI